jgi:hypothetical protein
VLQVKSTQTNDCCYISASRKTALYQKIIENYNTTTCPLNSRLIREITFNLNVSGHRIDSICERIIDYISENGDYVIGDTVEKVY